MKARGLFVLLFVAITPSLAVNVPSRLAFVPRGGKPAKAATPTTAKPTKKSRYDRFAEKIFDDADQNDDGSVDFVETYTLALRMYIILNRQAPIPPPTRKRVLQLFLRSDVGKDYKLNKVEFVDFLRVVTRRALWRVTAVKLCKMVVAPLLTEILIRKLAGKKWLHDWAEFVVPARFHAKLLPNLLSTSFWRPVLLIALVTSLGNVVLGTVDWILNMSLSDENEDPRVEQYIG